MGERPDQVSDGGLPVLDVRPAAEFERRHLVEAVNIPLEELAQRIHELPEKGERLAIFEVNEERARSAEAMLRLRGRTLIQVRCGAAFLESRPTASGPSGARLWQPHRLLVQAVEYAAGAWGSVQGRRAVDIACGSGRDAVYLAMAGFEVDAWDVLPDAVALCRDLAGRSGVRVAASVRDLRVPPREASDAYDLVSCFYFLHRPLVSDLKAMVRAGGLLVYETFVEPQRELHGRPRCASRILRQGELRSWFSDWEVVAHSEGRVAPGRQAASIIARRKGGEIGYGSFPLLL